MTTSATPAKNHQTEEGSQSATPGAIRIFESGATRDTDEGKLDYEGFLSPIVLERYGQYMQKHRKQADGSLRTSDNWTKGIPRAQYMKSLVRHVMDLWRVWREGGNDATGVLQELCCAVMFNSMGFLHETLKGRE